MKARAIFPSLQIAPAHPKKTGIPKPPSKGEETFVLHCRLRKLPMFKREFKFALARGRGWLFDFAFVDYKVAVEIEGLVAMRARDGSTLAGGRHATFQGWRGDAIKYATAAVMGWSVLRFDQSLVKDKTAIDMTHELLRSKGWAP